MKATQRIFHTCGLLTPVYICKEGGSIHYYRTRQTSVSPHQVTDDSFHHFSGRVILLASGSPSLCPRFLSHMLSVYTGMMATCFTTPTVIKVGPHLSSLTVEMSPPCDRPQSPILTLSAALTSVSSLESLCCGMRLFLHIIIQYYLSDL